MVLNYYRIVTFRIQYYNKYEDLSSKAGISAGFSDFRFYRFLLVLYILTASNAASISALLLNAPSEKRI